MNVFPSRETYRELSKKYSHIPVSVTTTGDIDTPVSLYLKVRDYSAYSFLLESALQSGSSGRYSFIGYNPVKILSCKNGKISVQENGITQTYETEPFSFLKEVLQLYRLPPAEDFPVFTGGLVGYFGYDIVRQIEKIPDRHRNEFEIDDFTLILVESVIIYDHFHHTIQISILSECTEGPDSSYDSCCRELETVLKLLTSESKAGTFSPEQKTGSKLSVTSNIERDDYLEMVIKAKEFIAQGDIFQIVLSQRFGADVETDGFTIYRHLRQMNPSPYMFYLALDDKVITGSSPEVLVKTRNNIVVTRPLAGTRPRGKTPVEDREIEKELLSDEKERAEHVMLIDLGRNDLGKFCKFGSVHVPEFMEIERYSHVMHIVSEVVGRLEDNKDCIDVFKGTFPAGTVSGAPKIRAMELIDELEKSRRNIYAGSVGYFDFHNNMDTCITIRTILIVNGTAYVQAGAGIVADSNPENEYRETINKAYALLKAIAQAEGKIYDISA
ncbi:anthranilate synthase component I [candidate division KSB1 bacterium]